MNINYKIFVLISTNCSLHNMPYIFNYLALKTPNACDFRKKVNYNGTTVHNKQRMIRQTNNILTQKFDV